VCPKLSTVCVTKVRAETVEMLHEQEEAMGRHGGSPQRMEPHQHRKPQETRRCSHALDTLTPRKPMGSPGLAALLLPLLQLLVGLSAAAGVGCPCLPSWSTVRLLASHVVRKVRADSSPYPMGLYPLPKALVCLALPLSLLLVPVSGLQWGWLHLLVQKSKKSYKFRFCRRHTMPASAQRKLLSSRCLSEKGHHISVPSPDTSHKGLRSKRTQSADPEKGDVLSKRGSQRLGGPEFSFDLLPEARVIQVTVPPGPEVSVRLCHQWALECEELSRPFDAQKIVSGGCTVDLPYEFLLPCLCIEVSYLQEDTVRHKKCPFQSWRKAYGSDFWESVNFTDHSQHSQMIMALTLRCPLKLDASLCQRRGWHTLCEDVPNATARESEGWYVLEKVDLHPQLCFKVQAWATGEGEGSLLETAATLNAPTRHSTQGSSSVTLDLIVPFLRPGGCVLGLGGSVPSGVEVRCPVCLEAPPVSGWLLGLLILALLAFTTLLGVVLVLTCQRPLS
ncbi:hypothetical protein E2I00_000801, partial [Balaenoptera physalus]